MINRYLIRCSTSLIISSVQLLSCVRLCDPMNHSTPGLPVHHQLPELFFYPNSMAPHSSTLAWKIPWMEEEPGRLQSMGSLESDTTERLHYHFSLSCIGEGNGNPLQCSCLEDPRDGEAWWAAIYGVAQSRTRLKQLSSSSSRKDVFS